MALELAKKGQKINLTKDNPGLKRVIVGLGWDTTRYDGGQDYDLDASAFLLNANGKCRDENDFIFYNNLEGPGITHTGDNRDGEGDGDDEQLLINFDQVPSNVDRLAITVTIHDALTRRQNFGQVRNAYVRLVDQDTNEEFLRYDLGEDFSIETAAVFCELYRYGNDWKFNAVGAGYQGGLESLIKDYGLEV